MMLTSTTYVSFVERDLILLDRLMIDGKGRKAFVHVMLSSAANIRISAV